MFKENIKIAIRNITKDKLYFSINTLGLALGIVCSLFILIYVQDELRYDKHFKNSDNIYRLTQNFLYDQSHFARCAPAFAPLLHEYFPEIKEIVRLNQQTKVISIENKKFKEDNFFFADTSFFSVFDFKFIEGNSENALKQPNSLILTKHIAEKYFGKKDPLNETILILNQDGNQLFKVTGIIEDSKRNSHFHVDILASFNSQNSDFSSAFVQMANFYTYLTLPVNYDYKSLEAKFPEFLRSKLDKEAPTYVSLILQPLKNIHLKSSLQREIEKNGDIKVVFIFSIIAIFILIIASINYINLSIARSSKRANEISLRKIFGANKVSIIKQYFIEFILFCITVLVLSIIILTILYIPYKNLINKDIVLFSIDNAYIFLELIGLIILVGFISGIYPAIILSSFKPLLLLEGVFKMNSRSNFRKILIVFQFTITSLLIICSMVIFSQIKYMGNKDIGFNKENIIVIQDVEIGDRFNTLRKELLNEVDIIDVTAVMRPPSVKILDANSVNVEGFQFNTEKGASMILNLLPVQTNFIDFMQMKMIAGRNFSKDYSSDTSAYIINETSLKKIGWKSAEVAIGKQFSVNNLHDGTIIGVVKDFNYSSLREKIDPLVLFIKKDWLFTILIKTKPDKTFKSIPYVKGILEKIYPDKVLEYTTLTSLFDDLYVSEKKQLDIVAIFSVLAIIISCLGLFGLLSFIIEQKTKDVAIRKVHGASEISIEMLFLKDFAKLIIIGNILAFLLAYDLINSWFQNFAYHTNFNYWILFFSFFITLIITFFTVSSFTIRAAKANPLIALKSE